MRWVALGLSVSSLASAAPMVAQRASAPITLDGHLDEAAWAAAPVFDGFLENFPQFGQVPDKRTEVRVLFDDSSLYVGVRCFDPEPALITRSLGRRDAAPPADTVELSLDANGDHRTAFSFIVNAAGLQRDVLRFADFNATDTWDAVWGSEVSVDAQGWTVEFQIPLRILRITREQARWGVAVRRSVNRTHQVFDSSPVPREANTVNSGALVVSRFGTLEGLSGLEPTRDFEVTPYLAGRASLRPRFSDETVPQPRLWDPSFDVGADFKVALTSRLSLNAALNPDFGQVEVDQVIQNLSTVEAYFPEKRPFFLQGLDVFQSVGSEYGAPHQLFYSRRIGLRDPILGALKVTGSLTDSLDVGVLDSLVMGPGNPSMAPVAFADLAASETSSLDDAHLATLARLEATPDRRWQLHASAPFHLGPNDALPIDRPTPRNYFAAVARQRLGEASSLGATFTASTPLAPRCTPEDFATAADFTAAGCFSRGANALAVDWNLRTASGEWGFLGQAEATQQVGGDPAGRILRDGTLMRPGDLGVGGYLHAGKLGGEPFRYDVSYIVASDRLDLNSMGMGFQRTSNNQMLEAAVHYTRPNGVGGLRSLNLDAWVDVFWSADGHWVPRGLFLGLHGEIQLQGYEYLGFNLGWEDTQFDPREIVKAGVPFQRLPDAYAELYAQSDTSKPLVVNVDGFLVRWVDLGANPGGWGGGVNASVRWQPLDALETSLLGSAATRPVGARYLDTVSGAGPGDGDRWVFGSQLATNFSLTLRQQVVLTPRLSFQVYAQLFSGAVQYGQYWQASARSSGLLGADQLTAAYLPPTPYDEHTSTLNLSAVLRWEYRLGSTLYVVYSRAQQERVRPSGEPVSSSLFPSQLFQGPATDTFLVKLTYWWTA